MPTSFQMLLLLLLICVSLTESAVLHPKLRRKSARKETSSEEDDEEQRRTTTSKGSTKWYGADAEDIINQLEQIASDRQARVQVESNREDSFLNRLKALFTAPENVRPNGQLNDCFFTPMNCQLGGQKAAHRKGHGVKVLVVRDEDLAKLVQRQKLAHGDVAKEEGGEKDLAKLDRRHVRRRRKNGKF